MAIDTIGIGSPVEGTLPGFDEFYRSEFHRVVALAFVLSGDRAWADDYAQDALLAAYRNWDQIGSYADPGAWVRRVLANRVTSAFRRTVTRARALPRMDGEQQMIPDLSVFAESTWNEVRRLPRRQSQVIALRYLDARSVSEIADILECGESTVKTHLRRAKQTRARRLESEDDHDIG